MDIKETGKKLKPFAPVLSVALVTACVAGSLSGYEAPVYAATQEETPIKEETKEKKEEKKTAAKGSFDLEDGVYKGTGSGYCIGSNFQFQRNHQCGEKCADRGKG